MYRLHFHLPENAENNFSRAQKLELAVSHTSRALMALNWQPPSLCNSVRCLAHFQLCLPETLLCLAFPTCPRSVSCTDYLQSCLRMPKTTFPSPKSLNRHAPSLRKLLISVHRPSCCSQPHGTAFVLCAACTFTCPRMPKTTFPGPKSLNWQSRTLPELSWP